MHTGQQLQRFWVEEPSQPFRIVAVVSMLNLVKSYSLVSVLISQSSSEAMKNEDHRPSSARSTQQRFRDEVSDVSDYLYRAEDIPRTGHRHNTIRV